MTNVKNDKHLEKIAEKIYDKITHGCEIIPDSLLCVLVSIIILFGKFDNLFAWDNFKTISCKMAFTENIIVSDFAIYKPRFISIHTDHQLPEEE